MRKYVYATLSGTTASSIYDIPPGRKARITKVVAYNGDSADHTIRFVSYDPSTSSEVADIFPQIPVATGSPTTMFHQTDLPCPWVESSSSARRSIAAKLDAATTAGDVEVAVEIEEE